MKSVTMGLDGMRSEGMRFNDIRRRVEYQRAGDLRIRDLSV